MRKITMQKNHILALVIAGILATTSPALAGKPSWAGGGDKGGKHEQKEGRGGGDKGWEHEQKERRDSYGGREDGYSHDQHGDDVNERVYFVDQHRNVIRNYYEEQYRSGHCPPGLAKKNNGCMPRGQARMWHRGRPLPRDVIFYNLPPAVIVQLGPPPAGHRYIRVATDILLIAVGTGMIVDAIQDLNVN